MNKRIAEALVDCGYADDWDDQNEDNIPLLMFDPDAPEQEVDPLADTLEGYSHAFALQDWLWDFGNENSMWNRSEVEVDFPPLGGHRQWQKNRIKWCFKQLEGGNNGV